jgi:hypothetical protein
MGEGICAKTSTPINEDVKMANSRNKYLIYGRILFNLKNSRFFNGIKFI